MSSDYARAEEPSKTEPPLLRSPRKRNEPNRGRSESCTFFLFFRGLLCTEMFQCTEKTLRKCRDRFVQRRGQEWTKDDNLPRPQRGPVGQHEKGKWVTEQSDRQALKPSHCLVPAKKNVKQAAFLGQKYGTHRDTAFHCQRQESCVFCVDRIAVPITEHHFLHAPRAQHDVSAAIDCGFDDLAICADHSPPLEQVAEKRDDEQISRRGKQTASSRLYRARADASLRLHGQNRRQWHCSVRKNRENARRCPLAIRECLGVSLDVETLANVSPQRCISQPRPVFRSCTFTACPVAFSVVQTTEKDRQDQ